LSDPDDFVVVVVVVVVAAAAAAAAAGWQSFDELFKGVAPINR
jgi:hypothetical protein